MNPERLGETIKFPAIAKEIAEMYEADQAMRIRWEEGDYSGDSLDEIHTKRMKEIVEEIGWPTASKVGKEVAENAWLLVQHSDHDVDFQLHCLELMKNEPMSEVSRTDIAFLEDRARVNQGKSQLYGTQFRQENKQHIPITIEDEANVDQRRAEMGMGPLQERIDEMYEKYPFDQEGD